MNARPNQSSDSFLFPKGTLLQHRKTGGIYTVLETPDVVRIEAMNQPAYLYTDGRIHWVRPQSEMEDGRFIVLPVRPESWG